MSARLVSTSARSASGSRFEFNQASAAQSDIAPRFVGQHCFFDGHTDESPDTTFREPECRVTESDVLREVVRVVRPGGFVEYTFSNQR